MLFLENQSDELYSFVYREKTRMSHFDVNNPLGMSTYIAWGAVCFFPDDKYFLWHLFFKSENHLSCLRLLRFIFLIIIFNTFLEEESKMSFILEFPRLILFYFFFRLVDWNSSLSFLKKRCIKFVIC